MIYKSLDVVVVPFPFTDRQGAKRRPALVVSSKEFNGAHAQSILAMITSSKEANWPSDIILQEWQRAGLSVPCRVRLKLFTLDNALIIRDIGSLTEQDGRSVRRALRGSLAVE